MHTSSKGVDVRLRRPAWSRSPNAWILWVLVLFGMLVFEPRRVRAAPTREGVADALGERLDRLAAEGRFSGAMVVLEEGHPALERSWGDRGDGRAPDSRTAAWIASLTKSFTAAAIFVLRDRGVVQLDDPVAAHFPDAPDGAFRGPGDESITIDHLLTHSSGLRLPPLGDIRDRPMSPSEFSASLAEISAVHPPGTRVEYSNAGYVLLGVIVERASRTDYTEFVTSQVLDPAGLTRTGFDTLPGENSARGMQLGLFGLEPAGIERRIETAGAAGAAYSTAADLARWPHALESGAVVSADGLQQMFAPSLGRQARGWVYEEPTDERAAFVWHNGGWSPDGYQSFLAWLPDARLSVAVVSNTDEGSVSLTLPCLATLRGSEQPVAGPPTVPLVWRAFVTYKARHWGLWLFVFLFGFTVVLGSGSELARLRSMAGAAMIGNLIVLAEAPLVRTVCLVAGLALAAGAFVRWRRSERERGKTASTRDMRSGILVFWALVIYLAGMY